MEAGMGAMQPPENGRGENKSFPGASEGPGPAGCRFWASELREHCWLVSYPVCGQLLQQLGKPTQAHLTDNTRRCKEQTSLAQAHPGGQRGAKY